MTEARAALAELVNRVGYGKERIVLTKHGKALVALVPASDLDRLLAMEEQDEDRGEHLDLASRGSGPLGLPGLRPVLPDVGIAAQAEPPGGVGL